MLRQGQSRLARRQPEGEGRPRLRQALAAGRVSDFMRVSGSRFGRVQCGAAPHDLKNRATETWVCLF